MSEDVWYRKDSVQAILILALRDAIRTGGEPAKAFAWDVNATFQRHLFSTASGIEARSDETRSGSAEGESPAPEGGDAQ